jgi:hypothetical protein
MVLTVKEFIEYMDEKYPERKIENKVNNFRLMSKMAEHDPGMKDLLDRAEEYYLLKKEIK